MLGGRLVVRRRRELFRPVRLARDGYAVLVCDARQWPNRRCIDEYTISCIYHVPHPSKLTDAQRKRLKTLEPALRNSVRLGDYPTAKRITAEIQSVLRPTGHETRLMQAKNWLFEAAMEAGELEIATAGLIGIRQKISRSTRTHLEATALLAICYLRKGDVDEAEPRIADSLRSDVNIGSEKRRRQFRIRAIRRFEEEAALAALRGPTFSPLDIDRVQGEAGLLLRTKTEDEIYAAVGQEISPEVIKVLLRVHEFACRQLTTSELSFIPPARTLTEKVSLGKTITEATKRVVWRSLCDPNSEVYKAWCTNGMMAILNTKLLTAYLVSALSGMRIGALMLAASLIAIVLRAGLDVFCDVAKPVGMMIGRDE